MAVVALAAGVLDREQDGVHGFVGVEGVGVGIASVLVVAQLLDERLAGGWILVRRECVDLLFDVGAEVSR